MAISQKTLLRGAGLAGAGLISTLGFAALKWDRATSKLVEQLQQASIAAASAAAPIDVAALTELPAPVARYVHFALGPQPRTVRSACFEQEGHFRSGGPQSRWQPFKATEHFSGMTAGFVWDAAIQMAPFARVCVRDAYLGGAGTMQAKVLAMMTLLDAPSSRELDAGALQRYLAEAVWFPTALLPSAALSWRGVDDNVAIATLTDTRQTVSLEFTFAADGAITRIYTPHRYREVSGGYEPTPWLCELRQYEQRDGMRIPMEAEIAWQIDGALSPYCKIKLTECKYVWVD